MAEIGKFFRQIFQDVNGAYSSKRTVAILAFLFLLGCGIADVGFGKTVTEFIFEGFIWVTIGGLGITIGERVAGVFKAKTERISG